MSTLEQFQIPATTETESDDHDKEAATAALREATTRTDTLFAEHRELLDVDPRDERLTLQVGGRHNVNIKRVVHPDNSRTYRIGYIENVIPPQPDGSKPNYNPYDVRSVGFTWTTDADGEPAETTANFVSRQEGSKNAQKGALAVENYNDNGTIIFGALDGQDVIDALKDADDTVASALKEGKLYLREEGSPTHLSEPEPESIPALESKEQPPTQRLARLRKFGRNLLSRIK